MSATALPPGFGALEPFVGAWGASSLAERGARRDASCEADRLRFYEAAKDLVAPALDSLAGTPIAELSPGERLLLDLVLAWVHVALAVEIQGESEASHAALRARTPLTSPAA
jgi:hypothetical protein